MPSSNIPSTVVEPEKLTDFADFLRLIAVMLGILRMDIQTCIGAYLQMAPKIFPIEGVIGGNVVGRSIK